LIKVKGNVFACESECPHQGAPLAGALIKDAETLVCQRHGYSFNLKSGACKQFPEYTLKVYPVQLQGEDILVDIGAAIQKNP
jgi:nitrite reductase/ring-hydroxylating ferredoxin subunit